MRWATPNGLALDRAQLRWHGDDGADRADSTAGEPRVTMLELELTLSGRRLSGPAIARASGFALAHWAEMASGTLLPVRRSPVPSSPSS